ncbi:MAG: queuosine precursor transporter [Epsilonproteobacteria bacterium]|nr:queuosine precursor transporter [Campylobacterota bacterium]
MPRTVFVFSVFLFVVLIAVSNYTVQFPINQWLTYGAIVYPVTFLMTDILSEKYPKEDVLRVVKYGIVFAIIPTLMISNLRIALASIGTFAVVQLLDVYIFHALKERLEKLWWLRNNASTMTSQFFDTVLFFTLAFSFVMPFDKILHLIVGDYAVKLVIALLDTPIFYLLAIKLKDFSFKKSIA